MKRYVQMKLKRAAIYMYMTSHVIMTEHQISHKNYVQQKMILTATWHRDRNGTASKIIAHKSPHPALHVSNT